MYFKVAWPVAVVTSGPSLRDTSVSRFDETADVKRKIQKQKKNYPHQKIEIQDDAGRSLVLKNGHLVRAPKNGKRQVTPPENKQKQNKIPVERSLRKRLSATQRSMRFEMMICGGVNPNSLFKHPRQ